MRHSKSVRLGMQIAFGRVRRKTAPTGGKSVYLFLGFTISFTGLLIMTWLCATRRTLLVLHRQVPAKSHQVLRGFHRPILILRRTKYSQIVRPSVPR